MISIHRMSRTPVTQQVASSLLKKSQLYKNTLAAVADSCGHTTNAFSYYNDKTKNDVVNKQFNHFPTFDNPRFFPLRRSFSTTAASSALDVKKEDLNALDMSIVRQIKAELMEVDANFDGRLDADELKALLRKHNSSFLDEEIIEISDLYYAAKAGGSVSFPSFIEAIDQAVAANHKNGYEKNGKVNGFQNGALPHFRDDKRHPLGTGACAAEFMHAGKSHGHYTAEELDVKLTHTEPQGIRDRLALNSVKAVRFLFDNATGWNNKDITASNIMNRVIYLETIAAVPGMVAAIVRHFKSLRTMERDGGMLQMFLEEANNERMHLLTFVGMKNPGKLFRLAVLGGQVGFGSVFLLAYILSPNFCHRFVGYVEEEACSTYTKIIKAIEEAPQGTELAKWQTELAPKIAIAYWKLGEKGSILDLMYAVRADEAEHRDVNHLVCGMKPGQVNPLYDPQEKLDQMLLKYAKDIMKANTPTA